jgi:beta-glucosidase
MWGSATASYQIEGAFDEDGRGVSIWDTFSKTPGRVANGDTGDVACDHYHRFEEDIRLAAELGLNAYRFSIAWPRLFPRNGSAVNAAGIAFYNRLIDCIVAHGIEPLVTLYHWDLPQYLEDEGGWANRATVSAYEEYVTTCVEAFGDRVKQWTTLNEPWVFGWLGYNLGVHAPGKRDLPAAIAAAHHTALAHGVGTRAIRRIKPDAVVGLTLNMTNYVIDGASDHDLDTLRDLMDANLNRWWIEAFLTGKYPRNLVESYGDQLSAVMRPGDEELLKVRTDFLGVNYYSDSFLALPRESDRPVGESGPFPFSQRACTDIPSEYIDGVTAMGWPVTPSGLGILLERIHRDYPEIPALVVTENGAAFDDEVDADGSVHDPRRVNYLVDHISSVARAIDGGAPVTGYFAWSLLDNFEWAEGYAKRFGIVYVDFETQRRIPKESAQVYSEIVKSAGAKLSQLSLQRVT